MSSKYYSVKLDNEPMYFDGNTNREIPNSMQELNFMNNEQFSISFWIKTASFNISAILAKMKNEEPYTGWCVLCGGINGEKLLRFQAIHKAPDDYFESVIDAPDIFDNKWHHVVFVYDKTSVNNTKFFVDSTERKTTTFDNLKGSIANNEGIFLGSRSGGGCEFHGSLSDIQIYPSMLSKSQIHEIFSSSLIHKKSLDDEKPRPSVLILKNVKKNFTISYQSSNTIFEFFTSFLIRKTSKNLLALDDINLDIKQGEMVGIIGRNGSGKSTLLKIMSGVLCPTEGKVIVKGKIAPFLSLGSGFNPELNTLENIILYGMLLGAKKNYIVKKIDEILKFAELEDYIKVKLKNFSTGMYMRLAFSVAISLNPDIILIDEVLSVGDLSFQQKSYNKLISFKNSGKTIILVTHAMDPVEQLCDKAIFLEKGHVISSGEPKTVVEQYKNSLDL